MQEHDESPITAMLARWRSGDRAAQQELLTAVYPVLRDLARAQVRRNPGVLTLQATELANEAFVKLHHQKGVDWQNREHFYAIAATVIRRVVVDYLRARGSEKRGGKLPFVPLDSLPENQTPTIDDSVDWLHVDQSLNELALVDADSARVVELKIFSGLSTDQIAEVMGSSVRTIGRRWRFARAWLGDNAGVAG